MFNNLISLKNNGVNLGSDSLQLHSQRVGRVGNHTCDCGILLLLADLPAQTGVLGACGMNYRNTMRDSRGRYSGRDWDRDERMMRRDDWDMPNNRYGY